MNKEEFLKAIMELPKVETNNPIRAMNGINVDDLMNAVDRLNKVPDYNDLLKENQELKKQLEVSNELVAQDTLIEMKLRNEFNRRRKEYQDTYKDVRIEIKEYKTQQKEFIKYLENEIEKQKEDIFENSLTAEDIDLYIKRIKLLKIEEILQKYKEIVNGTERN